MVLMMTVADGLYTYPIIGFLVLSAVALPSSLYFWLRYRGDAKEVEVALDRVRKAKDEAERLLWARSHKYHEEYLDADYPDKQAIWDKNVQMWDDYEANPAKYIGDELSAAETLKYEKLSFICGLYLAPGFILVALLLLMLMVAGLWGVAILAFFAFLFATGFFVLDSDSEYGPVWLWHIPASIAVAAVVAAILIPVSAAATTNPPPGWVAQTHTVKLAKQADGTYGVGEPAKMRLDGTVSMRGVDDVNYSWAEVDSNNVKRAYDSYHQSDTAKQVRIMDDLTEGEVPYVIRYHTFDVLNGYSDGEVCTGSGLTSSTSDFSTAPCSDRNAWSKGDEAVVHVPRGSYNQWVLNQP